MKTSKHQKKPFLQIDPSDQTDLTSSTPSSSLSIGNGACNNDNDDRDNDDIELGIVHRLRLPLAGIAVQTVSDLSSGHLRTVSSGCAICLSSFRTEDDVTWASNPDCSHVFHAACIRGWLHAAGRRHAMTAQREPPQSRRRLRRQAANGGANDAETASSPGDTHNSHMVMDFPMLCPCCRQPFVLRPHERVKEVSSPMVQDDEHDDGDNDDDEHCGVANKSGNRSDDETTETGGLSVASSQDTPSASSLSADVIFGIQTAGGVADAV